MASRWLKNADVKDHVERFLGRIAQKYEPSAEKVIFARDSVLASAPVRVIIVDSPRPHRLPPPASENDSSATNSGASNPSRAAS
jgi:hypothetical protein